MLLGSSRWRRLIPAAFLAALLFLVARAMKNDIARSYIELRASRGAETLRAIDVELHRPDQDEVLGFYRKVLDQPGETLGRWRLTIDEGVYTLDIRLETTSGPRHLTRAVELADGATALVDVTDPPP